MFIIIWKWVLIFSMTAVIVMVAGLGAAQEQAPELDLLMQNFFDASTDQEKGQAINAISDGKADPIEVEQRLIAGRKYSKEVVTGWQILNNKCSDGKERPYHLYIPENYDPTKKYTVFFNLHGGVTGAMKPLARMMKRRERWGPSAVENDFIMVFPQGEGGALWWDMVGTDNILSQLDYIKRHYNVDENKVFLTGFSDGASGSYWMALHRPTTWAGFVPTVGFLPIAVRGPYQSYPRNLLNRPIQAVNAGKDSIFPIAMVLEITDQLVKLGVDIDWKSYPEAPHWLGDKMAVERLRTVKFVQETTRRVNPAHLVWETADTKVGRVDWLRIDEIKNVGNNHPFEDCNLTNSAQRVRLGIQSNTTSKGSGVSVSKVVKGSIAEQVGLKVGDVIISMANTEITDLRSLQVVLSKQKFGETIEGKYKRDDKVHNFSGQIPQAKTKPVFRREKISGVIEVTKEGNRVDVNLKNVAKYTLFISRKQFDVNEPIQIFTNGEKSFDAKVMPSLTVMLTRASQDNDRTLVYCAKIEIITSVKQKNK